MRKQNQAKSSLMIWMNASKNCVIMMKMWVRRNVALRTIVILGNKNTMNIMNLAHDNILSSWPSEILTLSNLFIKVIRFNNICFLKQVMLLMLESLKEVKDVQNNLQSDSLNTKMVSFQRVPISQFLNSWELFLLLHF